MSAAESAAIVPKRGRPPTGARERILEAANEVLKAEGYAGTTLAKVAAKAGESKALIGYHFGSKDGLVAAVGQELAELITNRVLARIEESRTVEEVVRGVVLATEAITKEDVRIPRLYFDLAAVSVVTPEVRKTITRINEQWRRVLEDLLTGCKDAPAKGAIRPLALMIIAGTQGLTLERIERGARDLTAARGLFVRSVVLAAGER